MIIKGIACDGTPYTIDTDEIGKELNTMTEREQLISMAKSGCFDRVCLLPVGSKEYESKEEPGYIETIESLDHKDLFHPLDNEGLPIFSVLLDETGTVIKK